MSIHISTIDGTQYASYLYVYESLQGCDPEVLQGILDDAGKLGTYEGADLVAVAAWVESHLILAADNGAQNGAWSRWFEWYPSRATLRALLDAPPAVIEWPAPAAL